MDIGISPESTHFIRSSEEEVSECTARLLNQADHPTAILYATDTMALTGMNTVLSMGLRVPEDISLAGIDDTRLSGQHAIRLTTVGHREFAMGQLAAQYLIDWMENPDGGEARLHQVTLTPELVVRNTTRRL